MHSTAIHTIKKYDYHIQKALELNEWHVNITQQMCIKFKVPTGYGSVPVRN